MTKKETDQKQEGSEVKIFTVPFGLEEIKENITITSNTSSKTSKDQIINQAFKFHSQGNISEAEKYYQLFINQGFKDDRVFYNYGIILKSLGKSQEAELCYRKAIQINPNHSNAYYNLGNILKDHRNLKEAEICYRKAIQINPDFAKSYSNLGSILRDIGKLEEAELSIRKAIKIKPDYSAALYNMGVIMRDIGKLEEAQLSYRKAIQINPDFAEAQSNLGVILKDIGKLQEAELLTRKAIQINPDFAEAHSNLGIILKDIGKLEEAQLSTRKAIEIKPDYTEAHSNLGIILSELGKLEEAKLSYSKAIQINPDFAEAHYNLGIILSELGKLEEAKLSYSKAIQINPDFAEAYSYLGNVLSDLGNYNDALKYYNKAFELNDNLSNTKSGLIRSKGLTCDWNDEETQAKWIDKLGIEGSAVPPLSLFYYEDNPLKDLKRAKKLYKEQYLKKSKPLPNFKNKKIHIGYFSADFREHPVMQFISPLLEKHDKSRFKIYLYSFVPKEDEYTEKAKRSECIFRDIRKLNDIEAVELARNDKLNIAIDLMGYTQHNRMSIFSHRVAPIQINFLGFPGSVGSETIDYIIADKILIPRENEKFYSEKIIRMKNTVACIDKIEFSTESIFRRDFNLPEKRFIFTCFNATQKITSKEFDIWMRLLKEIKGSVLWLYQSNKYLVENIIKEAEKRNVNPKRIIFAEKLPLNEHLARHSLGDLALDTFNYNGGTTTNNALWAGLPVLTKIGQSFTARQAASILTSIGLPELITYSESEYEEKALYIASNPEEVLKLKSKLNKLKETSPLYNSELYTQDLENTYLNLVQKSI